MEIDEINILNASFLAVTGRLTNYMFLPQMLLIDGNRFKPYREIKFECMVKAMQILIYCSCFSAGQNIAMIWWLTWHNNTPAMAGRTNVGYPTEEHRDGIR